MRLGRPLAAASAVAAMTGASLIASPALANDSNQNSPSNPSATSSPSPSRSPETSPSPSRSPETSPSPSGSSQTTAGSSFRITQEKTFVSASTNSSFTVSGTGCTGQQAAVGIALYAPDGTVSDVVKTEAAADGTWTADLDLETLIKSMSTSAAVSTDGWKIGAGCMTYSGKAETTQVTTQQQTQIYFDDTRITGSYEVSARRENQAQTFSFNAQGFYASETVTVVLKSKSDSSVTYTLGELTVDANGNLQGNLPAPTDAANGEYLLVLTGSHHSETATSQTVTRVSEHTFSIETSETSTTENNGGGNNGGSSETTERSTAESENSERSTAENQTTERSASERQTTERSTTENNGSSDNQAGGGSSENTERKSAANGSGSNSNGGNSQANGGGETQAKSAANQANGGGENKAGADQRVSKQTGSDKTVTSGAKESSSESRAAGETRTSDSERSLAHTGANGMIFGGIAALLVVVGGGILFLRRRHKA